MLIRIKIKLVKKVMALIVIIYLARYIFAHGNIYSFRFLVIV